MVSIRKIDDFDELSRFSDRWIQLHKVGTVANSFLSWSWVKAWWHVFGHDHELYILVAEENDEWVGIAPLMQSRVKGKNVIQFLGTPEIDYGDFMVQPNFTGVVSRFIDYLYQNKFDWEKIKLQQIPEGSPNFDELTKSLDKGHYGYLVRPADLCMKFIPEVTEEERPNFHLKMSSTKQKHFKRFRRDGNIDMVILDDPGTIKSYLPHFCHMHITRWNKTSTPSYFRFKKYIRFYEELIDTLSGDPHVILAVLHFRDKPVAYMFGFRHSNVADIYTITYDVFHHKRSPGQLLHYLMIDILVQSGLDIIDFLRGGEAYKNRFGNHLTTNRQVLIYGNKTDYLSAKLYDSAKKSSLAQKAIENQTVKDFWDNKKTIGLTGSLKALLTGSSDKSGDSEQKTAPVTFFKCMEEPKNMDAGIIVKEATRDDVDDIGSLLGIINGSEQYQSLVDRLNNGHRCLLAEIDGYAAGVIWLTGGSLPKDFTNGNYTAGNDEFFIFDLNISPVMQPEETSASLISEAIRLLKKEGKTVTAAVRKGESEFIQALKTAGFVESK